MRPVCHTEMVHEAHGLQQQQAMGFSTMVLDEMESLRVLCSTATGICSAEEHAMLCVASAYLHKC